MNSFKRGSHLWAATVLALLVKRRHGAGRAPPSAAAAAEATYQKLVTICNAELKKKSGAGEQFGWGVNYFLGDFVKDYRASKDTACLDTGLKAYEYALSKMSTGPDGYKGWIGAYIYDGKVWADVHVSDAILLNHLLAFAELVLADETLKKTYGEAANRYVALAKRDFFEKWDKRRTWHEDGPYGAYVQWDMFCAPNDLKTWARNEVPGAEDVGLSLPFNKQNDAGMLALKLYRITGEKSYRTRAEKIFAFMKSRMQLAGDYYCWNYWEPFGPWDVDLAKKDTRLWMNTHGGRPYQAGEVHQMVEAYNTGLVFDQKDLERIINTNLEVMWNKDRAAPKFVNSNAQLPPPEPALTPEQQKAREAAGAKDEHAGCLWTDLDQFSQTVRDLEAATLAPQDTLDRAYFENVTLKRPTGFTRLYDKLPATPFERPFSVVKSVTVASVMPCTITRGKPSIVLGKVRIPEQLEVAVYSADGQEKLLVLYQGQFAGGPSGHEGIQILQWDGRDPAGQVKLANGNYRVRWTVADGCREFPVTIAE